MSGIINSSIARKYSMALSGLFLVIMEVLNEYGAVKYFGVNTYTVTVSYPTDTLVPSVTSDNIIDINLTYIKLI